MGCWFGLDKKVSDVFKMLDFDRQGQIEREKVMKYWTGPFPQTYTQVLFQEIDLNKDGKITREEWLAYWKLISLAGFSQKDILQSLKSFKTGNLNIFFRYTQYRRKQNRKDLIDQIIKETPKTTTNTSSINSTKSSSITAVQ